MSRKKTVFLTAVLAFALCLSTVAVAAQQPDLENGSLTDAVNGVPVGWRVLSYYPDGYSVDTQDGTVTLSSLEINDLRLCQTVEVEPETAYVFSAEISTGRVSGGRGATLSIDNYSVDGTCLYSQSVYGNSNWQTVTLAFQTNPGQEAVVLALRLGGYSEDSSGMAYFRNVSFRLATAQDEPILSLEEWGSQTQNSGADGDLNEVQEIFLRSVFDIFLGLTVLAAVILFFGIYRNRDRLGDRSMDRRQRRQILLLMILVGLILRSILCSAWGGHDTDMSCWKGWGIYIADNGPADFYTAPGHEWYDYPPGYMLVLGFIVKIMNILGISLSSDVGTFVFMLPAYAADVLCAILLMRFARERGLRDGWQILLAGLVVFNPAAVVLSGAWGQIDSILTLFLLLTFLQLLRGRRIAAGALYGAAIMIKWQALIYGPVLAAAYLLSVRSWRDLVRTLGGVAAALGVSFLVILPFQGGQSPFWIIQRLWSAAGGYDYASVEAYNFQALCGGNWAPSDTELLWGITYKGFGTAAIVAAVILAAGMLWFAFRWDGGEGRAVPVRQNPAGEDFFFSPRRQGAVFLSASFCMYMIYTFGHYMHERYVFPVIFLLLFAFVCYGDRRLLACSLLLSLAAFLNEMCAMYVISDLAMAVVRSGTEHQNMVHLCAVLETASFFYFCYTCFTPDRGVGREAVYP